MASCCGRKKRVWTEADPYIVGTDEGDAFEVVANVNVMGFRAGERVWVRGSGTAALIQHGWVHRA